jgi:hypothetical protein
MTVPAAAGIPARKTEDRRRRPTLSAVGTNAILLPVHTTPDKSPGRPEAASPNSPWKVNEGEEEAQAVGVGSGLAVKIHGVRRRREQVNREPARRGGD